MKKNLLLLFLVVSYVAVSAQSTLVKQIDVGTEMFEVNGKLLFAAIDTPFGYHLFVSDGTTEGTYRIKKKLAMDAEASSSAITTYEPVIYKNELYFTGDSVGANGIGVPSTYGIWKSDGTDSGTVSVKIFGAGMRGQYNDDMPYLCVANNILFFAANDGVNGTELWKTDGTTGGTVMVKDINTTFNGGSQPSALIAFKNEVYFVANGDTTGRELWKSDGTDGGTVVVRDIFPGPTYSLDNDQQFTVSGNYLYFIAPKDPMNHQAFTYRSDGTALGTIPVDTIHPRITTGVSYEPYGADANGTFIALAYIIFDQSSPYKPALLKSDGTPQGTSIIVPADTSLIPDAYTLFSFNGKAYYSGDQGPNGTITQGGLAASDGTSGGTSLVTPFTFLGNSYPYQSEYVSAGNSFFFQVALQTGDNVTGLRMAQSNGTGTIIYHGANAARRCQPAYYNGALYFQGVDSGTLGNKSLYKIQPATTFPTGIVQVTADGSITSFPNPANETMNIHTSFTTGTNATLTIYNMVGERLHTQEIAAVETNTSIDVSKWASGVYFCTVQQNGSMQTVKVVVQH